MSPHYIGLGQTWSEFIANQAHAVVATDTRRVHLAGITTNATGA